MAKLKPEFVPPDQLTDDDIGVLVDIAKRQADLRVELKAALQVHDDVRALRVARALVGLERQTREQ